MIDLFGLLWLDERSLELLLWVLTSGSLVLLFLALWFIAKPLFDPVRQRLSELGRTEQAPPSISKMDQQGLQFLPDREQAMRHQLSIAGYHSPTALGNFYILRAILMITLIIMALTVQLQQDTWTPQSAMLCFGCAYMAGLHLPKWFIQNRQAKFRRVLSEALPDVIDLLIVCIQAGLGLNAALMRMAKEIEYLHPVFFQEINRLNAEIAAGQDRAQAIRGLAIRTGHEDIRALTSLLLQSLRFGTSITETLHIFGDELREKRLQRAEEQAAKMATKLVFPLIFCLLPAFIITAIGPGFLNILRFFRH